MTAIIAYGTVVRSPSLIGLPLPGEEPSVGFSVLVEEDFPDEPGFEHKKGLYRVVVVGHHASFALANLKKGAPVLVRGELFPHYSPVGDPAWNHRLIFGDEVIALAGELTEGRAYTVTSEQELLPERASAS